MTMPDDFDPTTITDPTLRAVVQTLMNQVETLHEQTRTQAAEIQRLRDEIARLKGEQGKPDIKPSRPPDEPHDCSSEAERTPPRTPRGKRARNTVQRRRHGTDEEIMKKEYCVEYHAQLGQAHRCRIAGELYAALRWSCF